MEAEIQAHSHAESTRKLTKHRCTRTDGGWVNCPTAKLNTYIIACGTADGTLIDLLQFFEQEFFPEIHQGKARMRVTVREGKRGEGFLAGKVKCSKKFSF